MNKVSNFFLEPKKNEEETMNSFLFTAEEGFTDKSFLVDEEEKRKESMQLTNNYE